MTQIPTTQRLQSVTVYCSSSSALEPQFADEARTLGRPIAEYGLTFVYGGGSIGLMGQSARSCKSHGGSVVGIITGKLDELEHGWRGCDELQIVESMQERRRLMMDRGDAYIVLPGGLGTYEEFFEVLVARQLGDHVKPIVIVNQDGYYEPLIAMIDHGIEHKFIRPAIRDAMIVVDRAADALTSLMAHRPQRHDPAEFLFLPAEITDDESAQFSLAS